MSPDELTSGAGKIGSLIEQASACVATMQAVLANLAAAAPDPGLSSALTAANTVVAGKLADLVALYEHISSSLTASADNYRATEADATSRIQAAGGAR